MEPYNAVDPVWGWLGTLYLSVPVLCLLALLVLGVVTAPHVLTYRKNLSLYPILKIVRRGGLKEIFVQRREGGSMKRLNIVLIMFFAFSLMSWEAYGGEPLKRPSGAKGDPSAILLIDQGIRLFTDHNPDAALSSFDMAIQMDPTISEAHFNAGMVALELGMREKGFAYLETYAKQRPDSGGAFLSDMKSAIATADGLGMPKTGFWEFGFVAVIGSVFVFMMAAYLISSSLSGILSHGSGLFVMGFSNGRVFPEKATYMVYPLLKVHHGGDSVGLFSLMERRGNKPWQFSESIMHSGDTVLTY